MTLRRALAFSLCLSAPLAAQIGDRSDRKGEVQQSLVPAELVPPAPALPPEQALATLQVAPGYRLEIAAADPQVQDPVAVAFGPDGRLWVVEMRGYMPDLDGNGEELPTGRISVLRDRDGDGRFEESTVFLDQLVLPRALLLVGDGVLVGAPPELAYWRDTDGDGRADQKTVVATDYGVRVDPRRPMLANPERAPNSLLWGHDNWIYSAAYTKKFRFVQGTWETAPTMFRGQWGLSQDEFGRLFHGSNSDHLRYDAVPWDYLQRNPHFPRLTGGNANAAANQQVWPARVTPGINRGYRPEMLRDGRLKDFTAAGGIFVYGGDLLPELTGNAFIAEPSANLVRRSVLTSEHGAVHGENAYAGAQAEFIRSTDERFRPVNFATGPDGALYVVDFYRGVLQHRISLTSYLRKQSEERQLTHPQHLGRIYRVVPATGPVPRFRSPAATTSAAWIERLFDASSWWRETAQRQLVLRRDLAVVPVLAELATGGPSAVGRMHTLWTLDGMGALTREVCLSALGDPEPVVRSAALRASERFLRDGDRTILVAKLLALVRDRSPEVQLQAVLTLGELRLPTIDLATANAVRLHPQIRFLRDAWFSGLHGRELTLLERLSADENWAADDADANQLLGGLARGILASRDVAGIERVLALAAAQLPGGSRRTTALLDGLVAAATGLRRPIRLSEPPASWARLEKNTAAKNRLAKLAALLTWPGQTGAAAVEIPALSAEQQARFEEGKALFTAICATCHQLTGRGLDGLAPPLLDSEWVLGPPERPIRIVLHGVRGPISVLGRIHTGDMPAFGALEDRQIAAVLTYIRREWGHPASPVEPEQVQAVRAATAGHTDAWSPEELLQVK